jgi:multidrug resistance efflux pump
MPKEHTKNSNRIVIAAAAFIVVVLGGIIAAVAYFAVSSKTVYFDKAQLNAPLVALSAKTPGLLRSVYVHEGDIIPANTVVAAVGVELIKSTTGGLVVTTNNNIGKLVTPQDSIVTMIDPMRLRVVGQVDEDKGLANIHVGQRALFTVDAFGGKHF